MAFKFVLFVLVALALAGSCSTGPLDQLEKQIDLYQSKNEHKLKLPESLFRQQSDQDIRVDLLSGFLDLSPEELENDKPPSEFDWRTVENRVTEVKDQGKCNAGWAFATTGLLEGQQVSRNFTQKLVSLSAQDVIDCSPSNGACAIGYTTFALVDIHRNGGINSETDYPYVGSYSTCAHKKTNVMSVEEFRSGDLRDDEIKCALVKYGPLAAAMTSSSSFKAYKSGIIQSESIRRVVLNHFVLIVGYGTDKSSGLDYWIVHSSWRISNTKKNSWGTNWGENGYARIVRGKNLFGLNNLITIATFK